MPKMKGYDERRGKTGSAKMRHGKSKPAGKRQGNVRDARDVWKERQGGVRDAQDVWKD